MAIINTILGGTDLASSSYLKAVDLNDTFNAAANVVKGVTAFWMNTYTRTLFDDFSGYTVGSGIVNAKYTVASSTSGTCAHAATFINRSSTNAGGSAYECEMYSASTNSGSNPGNTTETITINNLTANKHKHLKLYFSIAIGYNASYTATATFKVSFDGGSNYYDIATNSSSSTATGWTNITMIAKGSNNFDCYVGDKLKQNTTQATPTIMFQIYTTTTGNNSGAVTANIADIYESSGSI